MVMGNFMKVKKLKIKQFWHHKILIQKNMNEKKEYVMYMMRACDETNDIE